MFPEFCNYYNLLSNTITNSLPGISRRFNDLEFINILFLRYENVCLPGNLVTVSVSRLKNMPVNI